MQTKIFYAIVASALLFPVTVVAKPGHHQNIGQLIKDDPEKAKEAINTKIEHMTKKKEKLKTKIEHMTKHIENLQKAKGALDDGDTTSAQSIIKEWRKENGGHRKNKGHKGHGEQSEK